MVNKNAKPHHLVLYFKKSDPAFNDVDFKCTLYSYILQTGLRRYKREADKMYVYVSHIFGTSNGTSFLGGEVQFSKDCESEAYRKINNIFSALKSKSIFENYIFDVISVKDQDSMWNSLFNENTEDIKSYTIVYRINPERIREVTKYEFGTKYNLLVTSELQEEY